MLYLPGEFPLETGLCYLNHAAVGPWPRRTAEAVAAFAQQNMLRGASDYPAWLEVDRRLRQRLARLINAAGADDIALLQNTSEGLSIVSQGIDWQPGDEVVGLAGDFCSNRMPWQALATRGVHYKAVDALRSADPEAALVEAMNEQTRLLAISTVHFATGYRFDLQRLSAACRARGVLFCVDAIQSLGAVPFDLAETPADFVACGGHKWLLAPEGLGFLYCHPALRETLALHRFGWAMRADPYDFECEDWAAAVSARRFEIGTPNMLGIHALDASLSLFEEVGMDTVAMRLAANVAILERGLDAIAGVEIITPREPARRAGILTFRHASADPVRLHAQLAGAGVVCAPRAGGIRLAPHFYTPPGVLQRALEVVAAALGEATANA
jgi:selenocysteine lyase/cysteine desulfurase